MRLLPILILAWAAAFAASLWGLLMLEPTGDGFTRGLNRVSVFLGWQAVAGVIGIGIWIAGRSLPRGSAVRWLSRTPAFLALLLAAAIAGLIVWANLSKPAPEAAPPRPTTVPVKPDQ